MSIKIVFDVREAPVYSKCIELLQQNTNSNCICVSEMLHLGDISIQNAETGKEYLLIERKSFTDLLASIKDGRYDEQSYRLLNASNMHPHNIIYLLEGVFSNIRTPIDKKIIMSAAISLNVFKGFSVFRSSGIVETAEWIIAIANKIHKDLGNQRTFAFSNNTIQSPQTTLLETENNNATTDVVPTAMVVDTSSTYTSVVKKVKKENINADNIGAIMLCSIPGLSSGVANELMRIYGSLKGLIHALETDPRPMYELKIPIANGKTRKIAHTIVDNLLAYLVGVPNTNHIIS